MGMYVEYPDANSDSWISIISSESMQNMVEKVGTCRATIWEYKYAPKGGEIGRHNRLHDMTEYSLESYQ